MKRHILTASLFSAIACSAWAQTDTITAIYGTGNPDTGWTADTGGDLQLALRANLRVTGGTPTDGGGTYTVPTGNGGSATSPRATWNYEFSINSDTSAGGAPLTGYDFYLAADRDPSQCVDFRTSTVNPLTQWSDNSYGKNTTPNGQGIEGPAATLATVNNVAQNSQNIVFGDYPGGPLLPDVNANATYDYELFAVAKGAGVNGIRLSSVAITVVVGTGGAPCADIDFDGVPDEEDHCVPSVIGGQVDVGGGPTSIANDGVDETGCTIQDMVNDCKAQAKNHGHYVSCVAQLANDLRKAGTISNKQSTEMKNGAAKSRVGK
jgi:hypothetical protein